MAAPIRVGGLDAKEAEDLVQALAARGLIGHLVEAEGDRYVEVREAHEDTGRLLADVSASLDTWLVEHDRESVDVRVEDVSHTVAAGASIDADLTGQVRRSARRPRRG